MPESLVMRARASRDRPAWIESYARRKIPFGESTQFSPVDFDPTAHRSTRLGVAR